MPRAEVWTGNTPNWQFPTVSRPGAAAQPTGPRYKNLLSSAINELSAITVRVPPSACSASIQPFFPSNKDRLRVRRLGRVNALLHPVQKPLRAVVLGLYSSQYPAIGESHGLSVVAGELRAAFPIDELSIQVIDMLQWGEECLDHAAAAIRDSDANIVAIGLPYGTFSIIKRYYPALRKAIIETDPLIVFGGPIATYLSEKILTEVAPESVIIRGEAEEALPQLIECWRDKRSYADIPNLHYVDPATRKSLTTVRRLSDLSTAAPPYREHISGIHSEGGQIYCESSRGCSWSACTFCLRGLTDVAGRAHEYRRKNISAVIADFLTLHKLGISEVTFADEDFLGSSLAEAEKFIADIKNADIPIPGYDASLTVHSVMSRREGRQEERRRRDLLANLTRIGLQKAFLGIESCSASQLKRYAKGHNREQAVQAVRILQGLGVRVEIGVILFDPLCTLLEVRDSLQFMRQNQIVTLASGLTNPLRLQASSHYLAMLSSYEQRHDVQLRSRTLDPDTLSYAYKFQDSSVAELFDAVSAWDDRLRPLYYPAKSLSRFGSSGSIGGSIFALRDGVADFRSSICDAVIFAIDQIMTNGSSGVPLNVSMPYIARELADCVSGCISVLGPVKIKHPVVQQALEAARNVDILIK